jgi:hypothetical protein
MAFRLLGEHRLADFLNDTFALVPPTWKRALPLSIAVMLPGSAFMVASVNSLVGLVNSIIADSEVFSDDPGLILSSLVPFFLLLILASFAMFIGRSFQKAFVCGEASRALEGKKAPLPEALRGAARPAFARVAAQDLVIQSISSTLGFGIVFALFLPLCVGIIVKIVGLEQSGGSPIGPIVSLVALYLLVILVVAAAAWWLMVKTAVSAPAAVVEGVNSLAGMGRSLDLVRGRSWRVFGVMFIISLVISFGLGIVTGPITFVVILPGYFNLLKESLSGEVPSPQTIVAFLSSMSWGIGVSVLISGVVEGCLWPSFLTLLHADLRIRSGEREPILDAPRPATAAPPPASQGEGGNLA